VSSGSLTLYAGSAFGNSLSAYRRGCAILLRVQCAISCRFGENSLI